MIERDVVQLQYLSGVVRNVFAVGFAPHVTFVIMVLGLILWPGGGLQCA